MKMTCDDLKPFVDVYIDNEFDDRERAEFEAHLEYCEECRREVDAQVQFKQQFKAALSTEQAPEALKSSILSALQVESAQLHERASSKTRRQRTRQAKYLAAPAAAAIATMLLLPAFTVAPASSNQTPIAEQTVDWHRGDYPLEVNGPDANHVSRWFHGKVDFPVRLPHFSNQDTKLVGARIAHVQDRRAAYVLYELANGDRMSVMMFNGDGLEVPTDKIQHIAGRDVAMLNANGYDVAVMHNNNVTYTVTTELAHQDFTQMLEDSLAH